MLKPSNKFLYALCGTVIILMLTACGGNDPNDEIESEPHSDYAEHYTGSRDDITRPIELETHAADDMHAAAAANKNFPGKIDEAMRTFSLILEGLLMERFTI